MKKRIIVIAAVAAAAIGAAAVAAVYFFGGKVQTPVNVSHLSLGEKYLSELKYEQAVAELENAVKIEPNNAEAYVALSKTYRYMDDLDASYSILEQAKDIKSELVQKELEKLDAMKEPSPSDDGLSDLDTVTVAGRVYSSDITELNLRGMGLTDADLSSLSQFKKLQRLDISDNEITDVSEIAKITTLKKLFAANNLITDISPLASLPSLEYVGMRNNRISDADKVIAMDGLKYLHLADNQISSVGALGKDIMLLYLEGNSVKTRVSGQSLIFCDINN